MRKLSMTTSIGLFAGLAALIGGFLLEGGHIEGLFEITSIIIVFGGTFAAVVVSFPWSKLRKTPEAIRFAFQRNPTEPEQLIDEIVDMGTTARREGVLALETAAVNHPDAFLRNGLLMIVDGTDPELTRQILELEIDAMERKHEEQAKIFETAGGYAPTMGIIGTVMGLIHVLSNLSDPGSLGPAIAVAFTATLYGVASANVIYLPMATKIKSRTTEKSQVMEMLLEGILSIQAGENPQLIRKKLLSFMLVEPKSPDLGQVNENASQEA